MSSHPHLRIATNYCVCRDRNKLIPDNVLATSLVLHTSNAIRLGCVMCCLYFEQPKRGSLFGTMGTVAEAIRDSGSRSPTAGSYLEARRWRRFFADCVRSYLL
eukprot:TRINITY_DN36940_c0_g1_i1.p1 TRINITY_DN36940_c0_g1~~TRINITY_DN36940_c0_g1_i1.p1  ORF type:complete len:103 (+),score=8.53 TRINITY_DN36940_c0_g1_i1:69-377(+)